MRETYIDQNKVRVSTLAELLGVESRTEVYKKVILNY